jgi:hypothetical protein
MKHYYREKIVKVMVNCVEQEIEFPNIAKSSASLAHSPSRTHPFFNNPKSTQV